MVYKANKAKNRPRAEPQFSSYHNSTVDSGERRGVSPPVSEGKKMMGKDQDALFVGQWAAPFLLLGVYNKLDKVAGSDRTTI